MRSLPTALVLALAASLLCTAPAHAFSFLRSTNGEAAAFQKREVVFRLSPRPPAGVTAAEVWAGAESALARWSQASGLILRLEQGEPDAATGCGSSGLTRNDIVFVERDWAQRQGSIAETLVCIGQDSGTIYGADVLLNAAEVSFRAFPEEGAKAGALDYDLEAVLTHEIGHALGLGHSEDADAVMYGAGKRCDTSKRELTEDDVVGVQSLYPAAPEESVGCSAAPGGASGLGLLALLALALRRPAASRCPTPASPSRKGPREEPC